jgi:hypothetical protein
MVLKNRLAWLLDMGGVCLEGVDAGGAGGGAPSGAAPGGDSAASGSEFGLPPVADGGDPAGDQARGTSAEDDLEALLNGEDDDDDGGVQGPVDPQRFAKLRKAHNRLKRRVARDVGTLKAVKGKNLTELEFKAQQFDQLEAAMRRNPQLRAVFEGQGEGSGDTSTRPDAGGPPAGWDEGALPFDANANEVHRWMADRGRDVHELRRTVQELQQHIRGQVQQGAQARVAAETATWRTAIDAAAAKITHPGVRDTFRDAMVAAFRERARHGRPVQTIIDHYLGRLGLTAKEKQVASQAAAQRIAQHNQQWPRHMAGGGAPAPAQARPQTLKDVRRKLRGGAFAGG